jgi:hypothetical protein
MKIYAKNGYYPVRNLAMYTKVNNMSFKSKAQKAAIRSLNGLFKEVYGAKIKNFIPGGVSLISWPDNWEEIRDQDRKIAKTRMGKLYGYEVRYESNKRR